MQVKIGATSVGQRRGNTTDGYVLIYFSSNLSGESATQPHVRRPYVNQTLVKNLVAPVLALHCGDLEVLDDGDLFALLDGGKFANESMLVNSLVHPRDGQVVPEVEEDHIHQQDGGCRDQQ